MIARPGDRISIGGHRLGGGGRRGEILEVLGPEEHEYYRVRWQDGRETVLHPGSDAVVERRGRRPRASAKAARASQSRAAAEAAPRPAQRRRPRPATLRAAPGDRLIVKGHQLGERDRDAEVLEALGEHGAAPFRVRWSDSGRVSLLFPGPDAVVEHYPKRRRQRSRKPS